MQPSSQNQGWDSFEKKIPAQDFPYYASVQNYFDNNKLAITAVIIIKCFVYV